MVKRVVDITIAGFFLLILAPILAFAAAWIKVDSPGPILYRSPRLGKGGKPFGMLRFRTVDLQIPAHLSMEERMSRAGRFVRNYSIDDMPNLINLLVGDMSLVGPRPMEPERVELADPIWQQILAVKPGFVSPAVLQLATRYNTSPMALKQKLELEYVRNRSFTTDMRLFGQALRAFFASHGNTKARGKPSGNGLTER
jgi:lipopolysaccharide/colanic/teichoic acid biosynthesis glycosyltransferase